MDIIPVYRILHGIYTHYTYIHLIVLGFFSNNNIFKYQKKIINSDNVVKKYLHTYYTAVTVNYLII